eukprot:437817_1
MIISISKISCTFQLIFSMQLISFLCLMQIAKSDVKDFTIERTEDTYTEIYDRYGSSRTYECFENKQAAPLLLVKDFKSYKVPYSLFEDKLEFYPHPTIEPKDITKELLPTYLFRCDAHTLEYSSLSCNHTLSYSSSHPFVVASITAFKHHYPLIIKPIHIWILFLHGITQHINQYAEQLRYLWVNHTGKRELWVNKTERFLIERNWDPIPFEFVQQISNNTVSDVAQLLNISQFSKYTKNEEIAVYIATMDAMKNYFSYSMGITCAFPNITLYGTQNDWILLKSKIKYILHSKVMTEFGTKWSVAILPVLDRFISAYNGDIDAFFWHNMVRKITSKYHVGCANEARTEYTGWMNVFFPFSADRMWNQCCIPYDDDDHERIHNCSITKKDFWSKGTTTVPFKWHIPGLKPINMQFESGFVGLEQNRLDYSVVPVVGWNVLYTEPMDARHLKKITYVDDFDDQETVWFYDEETDEVIEKKAKDWYRTTHDVDSNKNKLKEML